MIKNLYLFGFVFLLTGCSALNKTNYELKRTREYNNYSYGMFTGFKPIVWGTKESNEMIIRTKYNKPFFALANYYAGQVWPITCGPATARIVLSAIYVRTNTPLPLDKHHSLYKDIHGMNLGMFTMSDRNVFDIYKGDDEDLDYDIITRHKKHTYGEHKGELYGGIDADKLAEIINMHKPAKATFVEVKSTEVDKKSVDNFRNVVKEIMLSEGKYMIANFHIAAIIPYTSGHFSPVVAYDEKTDTVLIMDVASHNMNWSWIKVEELYRAMNSAVSGIKRGYIIVEENKDINKDLDKNNQSIVKK